MGEGTGLCVVAGGVAGPLGSRRFPDARVALEDRLSRTAHRARRAFVGFSDRIRILSFGAAAGVRKPPAAGMARSFGFPPMIAPG